MCVNDPVFIPKYVYILAQLQYEFLQKDLALSTPDNVKNWATLSDTPCLIMDIEIFSCVMWEDICCILDAIDKYNQRSKTSIDVLISDVDVSNKALQHTDV